MKPWPRFVNQTWAMRDVDLALDGWHWFRNSHDYFYTSRGVPLLETTLCEAAEGGKFQTRIERPAYTYTAVPEPMSYQFVSIFRDGEPVIPETVRFFAQEYRDAAMDERPNVVTRVAENLATKTGVCWRLVEQRHRYAAGVLSYFAQKASHLGLEDVAENITSARQLYAPPRDVVVLRHHEYLPLPLVPDGVTKP